jgi:hypothetical protein
MPDGMQDPADKTLKPEKGVQQKEKPDMGKKPDLKNPEKPEEGIPGKPIPDMDPPGQEEPEEPD